MVVWLNAAPRMTAGARPPEEEKTALIKSVSGPTLPLRYGGLNGCSASSFMYSDKVMVYVERIELYAPDETGSSNFISLYIISSELAVSVFHSEMVITSGYMPFWGGNRAPIILFRMSPF